MAGSYRDSADSGSLSGGVFTLDEVDGTWEPAKALDIPADASTPLISAVGCRAAGNCVIAGTAVTKVPSGTTFVERSEVFIWAETSGDAWGQGQALPGIPAGNSSYYYHELSCVPGGDCTVAGYYDTTGAPYQVFAATIGTDGTIGAVQPVQPAETTQPVLTALDCSQDGYCTLLEDNGNTAQLLTEANPASLTLTASAPQVSYGTAETFTATVSSAAGGTPTGTVTVTGPSGAACTITLSGGAGSCTVNADLLIAHGRALTAAYPGDGNFLASTSPPAYLTIAPARPRLAWPLTGRPTAPASRLHGRPAPPAG